MNRKAAFAGAFYTGSPSELRKQIDDFIKAAEFKNISNIKAVISPHAGYVYSGPVAGCSFKQIQKEKLEVVLILALSHRGMLKSGNFATVIPEGTYETPLGISVIDQEIGHSLLGLSGFTFHPEIHEMEHSLEVQIPFVQRLFPDASVVPVIISTVSFEEMKKAAEKLHEVFSREKRPFMTIISTDLSHFHKYDAAVEIDRRFINCFAEYNPEKLYKLISDGKAEACGIAPVLTGMMFARMLGAGEITEISYKNSGDTAGDKSKVVGYLSAVIHGGSK
ncbi:MAG: AmmeMemoRadiSam system protein B [Spirochaetes bacterium]|nr:AmmeMemoRadiSam system protein B [Spirochaetota bacterium]